MAHLTAAVSEPTFVSLFNALRDNFTYASSDSVDFGPFTAGYDLEVSMEGGSVDLRDDNTVQIKELDIKLDKLDLSLGLDIPRVCVGGFCIVWVPIKGCILRAPRWCFFEDDPDVEITLPLGGLIRSEISFTGSLRTEYFNNPGRLGWMDDWDARDAGVSNEWRVFVDPQTIDLDFFDIPDMIGDLLEDAVDLIVDELLSFLPGWARDPVKWVLGAMIDVVRAILDIGDDIMEWFADLLNISFGLGNLILTFVADYFAAKYPIVKFEDPVEMLKAAAGVVPVLIPVRGLNTFCNDKEMVLEANVG